MRSSVALMILGTLASSASAGVYGTSVCSTDSDCEMLAFVSMQNTSIPPFAIAHPPGYDGSGGELEYVFTLRRPRSTSKNKKTAPKNNK